jgi:hypothetical protein
MEFNGTTTAILLGVWMTFALDIYGSTNSSPQTTEINAGRRADTLMKWVYLGGAMAVGGGAIASVISKSVWPLVGTASISVLFTLLYIHAKNAGLESGGLSTENN